MELGQRLADKSTWRKTDAQEANPFFQEVKMGEFSID